MELLRDFKNIDTSDISLAGGKGASLGEMTKAGIPIPSGFVILSNAFEKFLEETDLNVEIDAILGSVNHKEIHTVEHASEKIEALILGAVMPKDIKDEVQKFFKNLDSQYVAVRSSATAEDSASAAWAGQLESYLNTTEKNLLENVKKCWASLFTPRSIFYRFEKDLHKQKISVAVVVQMMIESEKSGIAFSVHPVTQDRNQVIIEAGFGLGEAIVSGQITPDSYVVKKQPRQIIDKNVQTQSRGLYRAEKGGNEWQDILKEEGEKQVLSDEEILELSETILRIENHYGFPCDIEWVFENGKFYIVQSRPITTLHNNQNNLSSDFLRLIGDKKLYPPLNNYSAFIQSSEYNIQKYHGKWYDNKVKLDLLILMRSEFSQVWLSETDIKLASEYALKEFITSPKKFDKRLKLFYEHINKINELYEKYSYEKINNGSWDELIPLVDKIRDLIWDANAAVIFTIYLDKDFCWNILESIQYKITRQELEAIWPYGTEPAFESFDKAQLEHFLNLLKKKKKLSEISEQCQYFLTDYFSAKSLDVIEKTLQNNFSSFINNSASVSDTLIAEKEKLQISIEKHEKWLSTLTKNEKEVADYLQVIMKTRDRRKNFFAKGLTIIYRIAEKMFSEVGLPFDLIPFYTMKELNMGIEYLKKSAKNLEDRKNGFQLLIPCSDNVKMLEFPIDQAVEEVNTYFVSSHSTGGTNEVLKGQIGSKGNVRGKVRIVLNVNSDHGFQNGEILVTGMTRPEYVPLMKKASGVVTDEGGITCHAAIISRELGMPCVIGTKIATRMFKTGDLVEVDANNGLVRMLEKSK